MSNELPLFNIDSNTHYESNSSQTRSQSPAWLGSIVALQREERTLLRIQPLNGRLRRRFRVSI
jgi:hypothetical protein